MAEAYFPLYVEAQNAARTKLAAFFNILQSEIALKVGILPRSETERQGGVGGEA